MTGAHLLTLLAAVATALFVLELVRRRQIRDKYAVQFLVLAMGMIVLAFAPGLLAWIAKTLSIIEPVNALFFLAILLLLASIVHLSWEVSRLESETRTLSEEVALLRLEVEVHHQRESRDTE